MARLEFQGGTSFSDYLDRQKKAVKVLDITPGAEEKQRKDGETDSTEPSITLPTWFVRTGLRSYEIETGLGVVRCRHPRDSQLKALHKVDEARGEAFRALSRLRKAENFNIIEIGHAEKALDDLVEKQKHESLRLLVMSLVALPPEWAFEGSPNEVFKIGLNTYHTGESLPSPALFYDADLDTVEAYLEFLPPTIHQQIVTAYALVAGTSPIVLAEGTALPHTDPPTP